MKQYLGWVECLSEHLCGIVQLCHSRLTAQPHRQGTPDSLAQVLPWALVTEPLLQPIIHNSTLKVKESFNIIIPCILFHLYFIFFFTSFILFNLYFIYLFIYLFIILFFAWKSFICMTIFASLKFHIHTTFFSIYFFHFFFTYCSWF